MTDTSPLKLTFNLLRGSRAQIRETLKRPLVLFVVIIFTSSCIHSGTYYEGKVQIKKKVHRFEYQTSHMVGRHAWACLTTAILWGGWCWYYLRLPNQHLRETAKYELLKKLGPETKVGHLRMVSKTWKLLDPEITIEKSTTRGIVRRLKDENPDNQRRLTNAATGGIFVGVPMALGFGSHGFGLIFFAPLILPGFGLLVASLFEDQNNPQDIEVNWVGKL